MNIDVLTLFPKMLDGFLSESIVGRALREKLANVKVHNLRQWCQDGIADDRPFGGGPGMVIKPEPLAKAINDIKKDSSRIIYLCPDGKPFSTSIAKRLAKESDLVLLSGHYENIDERIRDEYVEEEISIGDFVLTNGTLPAAVVIDAIVRYIPGALGEEQSLEHDSFSHGLLSYPQYTRPFSYNKKEVPDVLTSGNHEAINMWRFNKKLVRTLQRRPDLIFN